VDVVLGGALGSDRGVSEDLHAWLTQTFGRAPADFAPFERALTHGSQAAANYERLEFLGDRVLGLAMAEWLWKLFPDEAEGRLSKRLNALVTGAVCADVARALGVRAHLRLGKQARDDGASDSDNVLGDVMEALIGAWYLEAGFDAARAFVRRAWGERPRGAMPRHPKSALLEWTAAHGRAGPVYKVEERSGPDHAPSYTVSVSVGRKLVARGNGRNKQEAEIAAAAALLSEVEQ
jgi:ribonuclease-3